MSDATMTKVDHLHAQLRDLCIPWEEGYKMAYASALEAVTAMRSAYNEFAEKDPYEIGKVERLDMSAEAVEKDPRVQALATQFSLFLNRRGLLKIDL